MGEVIIHVIYLLLRSTTTEGPKSWTCESFGRNTSDSNSYTFCVSILATVIKHVTGELKRRSRASSPQLLALWVPGLLSVCTGSGDGGWRQDTQKVHLSNAFPSAWLYVLKCPNSWGPLRTNELLWVEIIYVPTITLNPLWPMRVAEVTSHQVLGLPLNKYS